MNKVKSIKKISPKPSRCISVDSPSRLFYSGGADGRSVVSHNSVAQRNVIVACIMRGMGGVHTGEPGAVERYGTWKFLGIDLKKVELSAFRKYSSVVLGVGTELEDALSILRFGSQTMMKRYSEMEALGVTHFHDLPTQGESLMIMCDEVGELFGSSGVKALSENTLIPVIYKNGTKDFVLLKDLKIGDYVLDNYSRPARVFDKYEPIDQERFLMTVRRESDGESEDFVSGAEHNWVAYFELPDGTINGPELVTAEELHKLKVEQDSLPEDKRIKVRFKRNA